MILNFYEVSYKDETTFKINWILFFFKIVTTKAFTGHNGTINPYLILSHEQLALQNSWIDVLEFSSFMFEKKNL